MKFLANENFPFPSIKILRERGYEVVSVSEISSVVPDVEVLRKASDENYIILTFDSDYGELIFKHRRENPPAVVYFRTKGQTPDEAGTMLVEVLETKQTDLKNFLTVVENTGVRQRKLR